MCSLLIVENEIIIAMCLQYKLIDQGYKVLPIARSAEDAVNYTQQFKPDIILMDILLQGEKTGIDAACTILADIQVPIIFITGNEHLLLDERLQDRRPLEIISKPPSDRQLFTVLEKFKK